MDAAAKLGSTPSPRALYEAEADYIWNSLRRLGIPPNDREDMMHEVFMAVFPQLDRYDPTRPLRPWLFGIAAKAASHYRRQPRHRHEVAGDLPESARDHEAGTEEAAERSQARQRLTQAMATLDLDRRAVVILHDIEGRPIPEVAEALEIPLNTAYSRLRLARAELAEALRRMGGSPL